MQISQKELFDILVSPGFISAQDFEEAVSRSDGRERGIVDQLVKKGLIKDEEYGQLVAQKLEVPFINLGEEKIDEAVLRMIPEPVARNRKLIAFGREDKLLRLAMNKPNDLEIKNSLIKRFGLPLKIYYATASDLDKCLWLYKENLKAELEKISAGFSTGTQNALENDARIVAIVDTLLSYAINYGASDIHIEPFARYTSVRFRIDGVMQSVATLKKEMVAYVVARLKILSKMRIDEHRSAQDGKFQYEDKDKKIDVRVSILPVNQGENVVLRLLSPRNSLLSLEDLGFSSRDLELILKCLKSPHGMILVTGPAGSGKTTTLYEILKKLNTEKVHIASIEDPVEYDIEGVSQIQVDEKRKLSFANGLRAIVRQDPDIIMVGEIRDKETAEIAVNAAMTGHLVLSTLHTNNAATSLPRLLDMDIEPFLIASTVNLIVAQRLVRVLCKKCRQTSTLSKEEKSSIGMIPGLKALIEKKYSKKLDEITWFKSSGCQVCSQSGYSGRIGIYEVMPIDDDIKRLILAKASSDELNDVARKNGMNSMLLDGISKAVGGETTLSEVLRVVND